jgi:hypothetical protein
MGVVSAVASVETSTATLKATTTTTTATTTHTTAFAGCGGVSQCLADPQCSLCLEAINATVGFPHTFTEFNSLDDVALEAYDVRRRALPSYLTSSTLRCKTWTMLIRVAVRT